MQEKKSRKSSSHKGRTKQGDTFGQYVVVLACILLLFMVVMVLKSGSAKRVLDDRLAAAKEAARPANIELLTITDPSCTDCFAIDPVVQYVKGKNVNVTSMRSLTIDQAVSLLQTYKIDRLPALIIKGEVDKLPTLRDFSSVGDALVYTGVTPPFTDPVTMQVKGRVVATIIPAPGCTACADLQQGVAGLSDAGIIFAKTETVNATSAAGKDLMASLGIEHLPAMVLSDDLLAYGASVTDQLSQSGFKEVAGKYVFSPQLPPYVDVASGEVRGSVSVIYLTDDACTDCYDAQALHRPILQRFGLAIENETVIDVSSAAGQALVDAYGIAAVPTVLLRGDVSLYSSLVSAWKQVGSIEDDGTYVFREMSAINQPYWDLASDAFVDASQSS